MSADDAESLGKLRGFNELEITLRRRISVSSAFIILFGFGEPQDERVFFLQKKRGPSHYLTDGGRRKKRNTVGGKKETLLIFGQK